MARAPEIPNAALVSLAQQIGDRLSPTSLETLSLDQPLQIAESFPVFMAGLDAIKSAGDIKSAVRQTGVWHHQIRHGQHAREFARSLEVTPSGQQWQLQEIATSDSAARIEDAIGWIDANVKDDAVACVIVVPAYYVTAFWLQSDRTDGPVDRVVVADRPDAFSSLQYHRLFTGPEFLGQLRDLAPAAGIPTDRGATTLRADD